MTLGTDGFGLADLRPAWRRHFRVNAEHIALAAVTALSRDGRVDGSLAADVIDRYELADPPEHR